MQRAVTGTALGQHSRLLSLLQPWASETASLRLFGTSGSKDAGDKAVPRTPGARVEFKSPEGVTRPADSTKLAQELGVEVEEADCEVEGQKVLTFRGKGQGPPGTKAPDQMKERDVFKASHNRQAAAIERSAASSGNPTESAQDKYAAGGTAMNGNGNGNCVPAAKGERLAEAKYTAKANDKISEARGKQPQPTANEEMSVNRYNAMKAAAAAAINRVSTVLSDTQQTVQDKTKETLDQGAQVMKDLTGMDGSKKDEKRTARSSSSGTDERHARSKAATPEKTEEAAHRGERDAASY